MTTDTIRVYPTRYVARSTIRRVWAAVTEDAAEIAAGRRESPAAASELARRLNVSRPDVAASLAALRRTGAVDWRDGAATTSRRVLVPFVVGPIRYVKGAGHVW